MKLNSFYVLILALAIALFFATKKLYNGSGKNWVGVAESKDYTISSEKQATVFSVHVVQGQAIKAGDTLIILSSQSMVQGMDKLESRIAILKSEKIEKQSLVRSEIDLLKSVYSIDLNRIEKEIAQAESELKLNRSISTDLKVNSKATSLSPMEEKIQALKEEITLRNRSLEIKIQDITIKYSTDQSLLQNQIGLLQNELTLFKKENIGLIKIATGDGVVESIPVKQGEEVDAYTSLLSILPKSPTSVIGYLHTEKYNPVIGTKVQLLGYDARWKLATGTVIGYGAITALPEILQKSTAVKAFGREIFISLPAENNFSTGEKVLIRLWEK